MKKTDGTLQMYVDYQEFKMINMKNRYSISWILRFLNQLNEAKIYTILDLSKASNLVYINE